MHLNNRLTHSVSVLQIPNLIDPEVLPYFGLEKVSDRSLNRTVGAIEIRSGYHNIAQMSSVT